MAYLYFVPFYKCFLRTSILKCGVFLLIVRSIDIVQRKEYTYTYENGRIVRAAESDITLGANEVITGKTLANAIVYSYDAGDKPTRKRIISADGNEQTVWYENPEDGSPVVKFSAGGKTITAHSKTDSFGRKVFDELQLGTGFVSRQFHYHAGEVTQEHIDAGKLKSTATTQLVSRIVLSNGRTLSYEYDAEERITKVTDSVDGVTEYTYDALGHLLSETKNGTVVNSMVYDNYGNIVSKNGKTYTYDSTWKDLLISCDGQSITYDAQGNPTSYLGHTLTWEKGRQLKSFDNTQYTYNANGIRTSKTVNGVEHTFVLDGTKILKESWNGNTIIPMYDNEDAVCGIIYNDEPYYFFKNLQGDIIAIADKDGKTAARYEYDAWGVCTVVEDTTTVGIAAINPFRYRGYYYDAGIGLYYLQSRYYNPTVGRFVNSDAMEWLGTDEKIIETNIFCYCKNNCINITDDIGYGGVDALIGVLSSSIDILAKIIDMIGNSYNKERKQLENSVKLLTKKQGRNLSNIKSLQKEASKVSKRLGWVGYGLAFLTIALGFASSYRTGGSIDGSIIEFVIETFIALVEYGAGKLFEWVARFIPYIGFLLGLIAGWLVSYLLGKFFNNKRVKRIKAKFSSLVKNARVSLLNWIKYAAKSLTA